MKLPISIAEKLLSLISGESIPSNKLKHAIVEDLIDEGVLYKPGKIKSRIHLLNKDQLELYLKNRFGIDDLGAYMYTLKDKNATRADLTSVAANSKVKAVRTFKGFLVNCYAPIECMMNGNPFTIMPVAGAFYFISDFENFAPPPNAIIVGVENAESFSRIDKQQYLFEGLHVLFVSRYPQNQSKDLIKWLMKIKNPYLHFGDFDFAGIAIYLHEYKRHLGNRSTFFAPDQIETLIVKAGSKRLYDVQKINFKIDQVEEEGILTTIKLLHKYKKGLEQEAFILKFNKNV